MAEPFLVAIRCPQCGAETDFPEGAYALRCAYCGVTLRVLGAHRGGRARFVMLPTLEAAGLAPLLQAYANESGRRLDSIEWRAFLVAPFWRARALALRWTFTRPGGPSLAEIRASGPTAAGAAAARPPAPAPPAPPTPPSGGRSLAAVGAEILETAARLLGHLVFGRRRSITVTVGDLFEAGPARDVALDEGIALPESPAHDERRFDTRHVDVSFPAFTGADLGLPSLGVRPAARPLRVLAPDALPPGALALPLDMDAETALATSAGQAFADATGRPDDVVIDRRAAVTTSLSAIYFPVWIASVVLAGTERLVVVDAVAGTVLREGEPSEPWFTQVAARKTPPFAAGSLGFLPLTCPECGAALPLETSAIVHLCTNCGRAWAEGADRLVRVAYDALPADGAAVYLPAWRFEAAIRVDGKPLAGASDMPRLVKPLGWPQPPRPAEAGPDRPPALYVPAFECHALTVIERLAGALARLQPEIPATRDGEAPIPLSPTTRAVGASLDERDAVTLARLFLVGLVPGSGVAARKRIASLSADLGRGRLVWLAAQDRGSYLQDRLTGVSLPKASLGWAQDGAGRPAQTGHTPPPAG